jgi:hypothetical protein
MGKDCLLSGKTLVFAQSGGVVESRALLCIIDSLIAL